MKSTEFLLLTTKRFLPLFITQFLGAFNDNVFKNALVILITYKISNISGDKAQLLVTFAAGIFILPYFLFSALAGELADKMEKSHLISIIKFFEIIIMSAAALGFYLQNVNLLLFVLFCLGIQATFFGPLKYSILPDHLQENELIAGNGLIEGGTFIAILLGTILGGLLILTAQGECIISVSIIGIAVGGWLSSLTIPLAKSDNPEQQIHFNIVKQTYELIHYSIQYRDLFISILGISWFWLMGATFLAEFPVFAKNELQAEGQVVTFFLTIFSVGLGIGSVLCNRVFKGQVKPTYVPAAAFGMTVFMVDLYFAARHPMVSGEGVYISLTQFLQTWTGWRISLDLLLIAICGGLYNVPLYVILQSRSDPVHRARVIASNNVINALFMVLAAVAIMLLLRIGFTVNQIFLMTAIINGVIAIYLRKLKKYLA